METINHVGKCVLEGFAFLFIGGVAIGMVLILFLFISVLFFSEGSEDSRYKRIALAVSMFNRGVRIIWWAIPISALAWMAAAAVAKIIHR